jgi:hypothetical protein
MSDIKATGLQMKRKNEKKNKLTIKTDCIGFIV